MFPTEKLDFLKKPFENYQIVFSPDGTHAEMINPFYEENIRVEYFEEDGYTPFIVYFSFQHCHLNDEEDVIDWIKDYIEGRRFAIEFFKNKKNLFGGDIGVEELVELSYQTLEKYPGYFGVTKLYETADSFRVRGWSKDGNFDPVITEGQIRITAKY